MPDAPTNPIGLPKGPAEMKDHSIPSVASCTPLSGAGVTSPLAAGFGLGNHGTTDRGERLQRVEDAENVIVGKFYLVPCRRRIERDKRSRGIFHTWAPLLGERHEDTDIGVSTEHWHYDWRFATDAEINRARSPMGSIETDTSSSGPVVYRRLKCKRPHLEFPRYSAGWLRQKLEPKYANASARCGVCPHRGIKLEGAPVINGARICPGHGLAWDVETGKLRTKL